MKTLFFILIVCSNSWAQSSVKAVFAEDDRTVLESHTFPYSAIVRLENTEGGHCTASLIGRDLILTNSHCLQDESGRIKKSIKAKVHGLDNFSPTVSVSDITFGTRDYKEEPRNDWALARISQPIGDVVGFFSLADQAVVGSGYNLVGFSGDFKSGRTAGVHKDCDLRGIISQHEVMMHDCDMTQGASGSAIWKITDDKPLIYALNSAQRGRSDYHEEWSKEDSNLSIPVETFKNEAELALSQQINHKTQILVCNSKNKKLKLAFGFNSESHSVSKGWVSVGKNKCRFINLPRLVEATNESFDIFAFSEGEDLGGNLFKEFCTGGFFGFEKQEGNCNKDKIKLYTKIGKTKFQFINKINL